MTPTTMRTILFLSCAVAGAVAIGHPADAQVPAHDVGTDRLRAGIAGGVSVPSGDLRDIAGTGYNVLGFVTVPLPVRALTFRPELRYDRFAINQRTLHADEGTFDFGSVRSLAGTLNVIYTAPVGGRVAPYGIGGLGLYNTKLTLGERVAITSDRSAATDHTNFGLNAGLGIRFPLGRLHAFAETRLHTVFTTGNNTVFIPVTAGISF